MSEKKIDVTKPVRMKDGTPVEVVCNDLFPPFSLLIVYENGRGEKTSATRTQKGCVYTYSSFSEFDLENVPNP